MSKPNITKVFRCCSEGDIQTELTTYINHRDLIYINIGMPDGDIVYENQCIVFDVDTAKELVTTLMELIEELE